MAWISGLAGKAENILNKLDQNAATALSQMPPNANETFGEMRKSLSSGAFNTINLAEISPAKSSKSMSGAISTSSIINTNDQQIIITPAPSSRQGAVEIAIEKTDSQNITEANMELIVLKKALAEVTSERNELRARLFNTENEEHSNQMWSRIQELEKFVNLLTEEREVLQEETLKLQTANSAYIHSISELETNFSKLKQEYIETAKKLQIVMKQTEQQQQDFQEYRIKAQNTLQMKENLIAEFKLNNKTANTSQNNQILILENDTIKEELKQIKEEKENLQNQIEQLRYNLQEINEIHTKQINEMRQNEAALRKELRLEREQKLINESEQRLTVQELYTLRHQYNSNLADAKARLQEKEQQLEQLKKSNLQQTAEATTLKNSTATDTEMRLKTLTEALVEKQNAVENITAERNALRIQLEKLQEKHSNYVQNYQRNNNSNNNTLLSNSTDDVKAQFPMLMTPNPFDNRVARRVKRAYSSLDSIGIRFNTFLRRYPLMRICVLIYIALLHIWVMFVLLSYSPN